MPAPGEAWPATVLDEVEQGALGSFEQDARAGAALVVEDFPDPVHVGQDVVGDRRQFLHDRLMRNLRMAEPAPQRIVMRQKPVDLEGKSVQIRQIHHPHGPATDLVFVGRPDASAGCPYFRARIRGRVFAKPV